MKNEVYKIKLIKTENPITGLFKNKTIKAIGHGLFDPNGTMEQNTLVITHADKSVSHISRNCYTRIAFSKELFLIQAAVAAEKSNGQVKVD